MKFALASLILASSSIFSVAASSAAQPEAANLQVRDGHSGRGHSGRGHNNHGGHGRGRGRRVGYYNHGRYWYWDDQPSVVFIKTLRYKPTVFYGQRFQYCYQYIPEFRRRWDVDVVFRRSWDSDLVFRNKWFGRVSYNKWRRH